MLSISSSSSSSDEVLEEPAEGSYFFGIPLTSNIALNFEDQFSGQAFIEPSLNANKALDERLSKAWAEKKLLKSVRFANCNDPWDVLTY